MKHTREPSVRERLNKFAARNPWLTSTAFLATALVVVLALAALAGYGLVRERDAQTQIIAVRELEGEVAAHRIALVSLPDDRSPELPRLRVAETWKRFGMDADKSGRAGVVVDGKTQPKLRGELLELSLLAAATATDSTPEANRWLEEARRLANTEAESRQIDEFALLLRDPEYDFSKDPERSAAAQTLVWSLRRVVETYTHDFEGDLVAVAIAGEVIEATANHPFWVVEGDGLDCRDRADHVPVTPPNTRTPGRWVDAACLRVGDVLSLRDDRRASVTKLIVRRGRQAVYNFQVEGLHTYAVGTTQVLVHNKPAANVIPVGEAYKPGQWNLIEDTTIGGGARDFVLAGRKTNGLGDPIELFAARITKANQTLHITWTASLGEGPMLGRLAKIQELAGGPKSFKTIQAHATEGLAKLITRKQLSSERAAEQLNKSLGGKWSVDIVKRPNMQSPSYDITATRVSEK